MAGFRICLVKVSQGCEYAFDSKYAMAQNMAMLRICGGYTGAEYPWISLNFPYKSHDVR